MRIVLQPVLDTPTAVGLLDDKPLIVVGRELRVEDHPVRLADAGEALAEAVDKAASAIFGGDYLNPLARTLGLNRRTVTANRIARNGLPAWALITLAYGAIHPTPRVLGYLLLAAAELVDAAGEVPAVEQRADLATQARQGLEDALAIVARARDMKRLPGSVE